MKRFALSILLALGLLGSVAVWGAQARLTSPQYEGEVVHWVSTKERKVALTFDDGPNPVFTPAVLAILKSYGVKATFFMVGQEMAQRPELVRRVVAEGHTLANHTYTHARLKALSRSQLAEEVVKTEALLERFTHQRPRILRPPWGAYSHQVCDFAKKNNYLIVLWTVCAEHSDAPTPEAMAQRVLRRLRPGGIVLMHDGTTEDVVDRSKTVAALPLIIEGLHKQGYQLVTLPELLKLGPPDNVGLCTHKPPSSKNQSSQPTSGTESKR